MTKVTSPDLAVERRADRTCFLLLVAYAVLSWIILSSSIQIEAIQNAWPLPAAQPWLVEGASHLVLVLIVPMVPVLLSHFPFSRDTWQRSLAAFMVGFLLFSILHILGMIGLRALLWPVLIGGQFTFDLGDPLFWIYEMRKDAQSFLVVTLVFWFGRQLARARLEAQARRDDAEQTGRLTLTSGGRTHVFEADDIRVATAAANYVEIRTPHRTVLVRLTLSELERLLQSAGDKHARLHRSCLVHASEIDEVRPNGDGTASVILRDQTRLKASRTYRASLEAKLSQPYTQTA